MHRNTTSVVLNVRVGMVFIDNFVSQNPIYITLDKKYAQNKVSLTSTNMLLEIDIIFNEFTRSMIKQTLLRFHVLNRNSKIISNSKRIFEQL